MVRISPLVAVLLLTACEAEIQRPGTCQTPAPKVRRMTRGELDATLSASTGAEVKIGATLAAEDMQLGYFGHDSLQVSTLFADQLDSATTALAKERAATVQCASDETERACAKRVLKDLAGLTWRRPLSNEEAEELAALFDVGRTGEDFATGIALPMQAIFEATGTLYKTELGDPLAVGATVRLTPWEIASELSFLATGGPPDAPLRAAAANGQLDSKEVRVQHLRRLLDSPAGTRRMRDFVEQWFGLTNMRAVQKNNEYFPKFSTQLRDDVAASAYQLMETAVSSTRGRVTELLTADYAFVNDGVAELIGATERPGPMMMSRVSTASLPRRGLLTHPGFLSVYAHNDDGSPVLRGLMVRTRLLCESIPPPPPTVVAAVQPVSPTSTTRERAAAHIGTPSCNGCHLLMDPIGFGLEGYDGFGEHRTTESGKPIDDTGEIHGSDVEGPFKGAIELTQKLAQSRQVSVCATKQVTRFAVGRIEGVADTCTLDNVLARFEQSNGSLYGALEGLVESDSFVQRTVQP